MSRSPNELRVLIVDDNPAIHEDFWKILCPETRDETALRTADALLFGEEKRAALAGVYDVDFAVNGAQALHMAEQAREEGRPFAVAFVDVRMPPGPNGVETLKRLWEKQPELQAVLCSGFTDHTWEQLAKELPTMENLLILKKPFEPLEVLQISYILGRKWQRARDSHTTSAPASGPAAPPTPLTMLLMEDEILTREFIERKLKARVPEVTVLSAQSMIEAQLLLTETQFDFFLLDVVLPDGSGIDFIADVQTMQPEGTVVMMTARSLGTYREAVDRLGTIRFLQKPINIDELVELIRARQKAVADAASDSAGSQFAATLTRLTPVDIIQLKCIGGASTTLEFMRADGARGKLCFEKGEIVHAETADKLGESAFTELMNWRSGKVEEVTHQKAKARTIHQAWQALLLCAVHQIDEEAEAKAA